MWQEGAWVRVATASGTLDTEECTWQVYTVNLELDIVVLMKPVIPSGYEDLPMPLRPAICHKVQVISTRRVISVQNIDQPGTLSPYSLPVVKPIKLGRLLGREQKALHKRQTQFQSRAPMGASSEALAIFSALIKTYLKPLESIT